MTTRKSVAQVSDLNELMESPAVAKTLPQNIIEDWAFEMLGYPFSWQEKAEEFHRAARLIYLQVLKDHSLQQQQWGLFLREAEMFPNIPLPDYKWNKPPRLVTVFLHLAGVSTENLLKGILVREFPDLLADGKLKGGKGGILTHDLVDIADRINLTRSDEEQSFLELASLDAKGTSRFPLPTAKKDLAASAIRLRIGMVYSALYDRLHADIEANPFPRRQP